MTRRLAADEVAADLHREGSNQKNDDRWRLASYRAESLVRNNLVPRWQDEPDAEGEYHVEGIDPVCYVSDGVVWRPTWDKDSESARIIEEPLNGRRVCPISERPRQ